MSDNDKSDLKLCIDCEYYLKSSAGAHYSKCKYKLNRIDLVTGEKEYRYCDIMRKYDCGRNAKYFSPTKNGQSTANVLTEPENKVSFWSKLKFW